MERSKIEAFFGPEWVDFMSPFVQSEAFTNILSALKAKKEAKEIIYPEQPQIFRAFKEMPASKVRVIILGMDPYPSEGYANGLAFAHLRNMKRAASMDKIVDAVEKDAYSGLKLDKDAFNTELTQWQDQGVMLLNSSLTVKQDDAGSHSAIWQPFTEYFVKTMNQVKKNIIWLAWGKQAQSFTKDVNVFHNFVDYSDHPAKAARDGEEWKTNAFSRTNAIITINKLGDKITW